LEYSWERESDLNIYDASVVIPAYNEEINIVRTLELLSDLSEFEIQVIIVVDSENDTTIRALDTVKVKPKDTRVIVQNYGGGPANAIRFGIEKAEAECVIIMMADGSDDARVIPELINLVSRGVSIACASRYMSGGQQIGGVRFKKFLSRTAGKLLFLFAGVGTHDATNSFKAYSREFLAHITIESRSGFEIGIELISKARRMRLPVAEVPTIWLDLKPEESRFKLIKWIPSYLGWFLQCFAPAIKPSPKRK
jgi:glycosyltransferase involved in cell wall biosynthesis